MSGETYFSPGDWNVQCFRCGFKRKASEMQKQWQGFWVCPGHWEPRQPQDFVRGVPDDVSVPYVQPDEWIYVGPDGGGGGNTCTPAGRTAIPALAMPGCSTPGITAL